MANSGAGSGGSKTPSAISIDPNVTRCNENILGFDVNESITNDTISLNRTLQKLRNSDKSFCDVTLVAEDGTRYVLHVFLVVY